MVIVKIFYQNFEGKKYQSYAIRVGHRLFRCDVTLNISLRKFRKEKKRIPYCMPHLFFLGTVFILWQINELGDFETLLYKMWHWNQQHFDVTSI